MRNTIERERLWLLAWWRWCCGHRCPACSLMRYRKWRQLDQLLLGDA
jgi:hypothetical protein